MARLFTDEEIKERQNAVTSSANKKFFTDAEIAERSKTYKYQLPEQQKPVNRIELDKAGKPILPKFEEKTIFDVLDEREAKKQEEQAAFAKRATENLGPGKSILYGVGSGMNRVATGLEQLHQLAQGNTNPVRQNVMDYIGQEASQSDSGLNKTLFNLSDSITAMAPSMMMGGPAGAALTGLTSGGNTYRDTKREGYSTEESLLYGAVNGALEGGLQYALGGLKGIGEGGVSKALSKIPGLQNKVSNVVGKVIKSVPVQNFLKSAGASAASIFDEGFEEYVQAVLDPVVRNIILDENNEIQPFSEDKLYAGAMGALTAGLMNLPASIGQYSSHRGAGKQIVQNGEVDIALNQADSVADPNTQLARNVEYLRGRQEAGENVSAGLLGKTMELASDAAGYKSTPAYRTRKTGEALNVDSTSIETAARVAEKTGRNIEFVETLGEGRNGKYDAETGTLYIAADSPNPVKTILKHELTHSLEGTQAYTELSKFVSDILVKETGMSLDEIIEAKIGIYGLSGETLDSNGALAELVADYVGDNLFTSEKAIRQLSAEKPSLARRILNWIRSMKTKLFGTNHEKLMAEAERMYHDALMEPFVKGSDSSYAKYSIQHDADGKRYVHIDTDQEIFNGKSVKEMRETARKYILDAFRGKVLPVGDGDKAFVNGRSASEYANPANRRMPDELKSAKMRASTELDNLLAVSDKIGNVPDDGRHPEATGGWDVYRTNFEVGGEMFSGEVKIKVTDKGRLFYDVTKIERTARNRDQTRFNPAAASGSSSDTTIPQTHNGVNTSISENSAYDTGRYALKTRVENSDGVELTDGQERYFEKSQARDDEGRLLVVYHATDADFTVFDKAKQGSANDPGVWGSGFYFDTDQSFAEEFGSKSKPYYLNITNPLRTTYDADCHVVAGIFRRAGIDIPFKIKPDTSLLQFIKKFGNRKFSDTLQALGYDGVIVSGEECVIFEPEQAKLTNNINPSGDPDIRHSIGVSSGDTIADIKAMVERYGAIKRGEAPARDVEIPKQTNDQTRTRQYVRTAAEASQVPDSFINGITQDVMNDVYAYVPISNNEAMERAVSTVENMGLDKAIEQWNAAVNGEHMPSKYDVALGEYLLTLAGKNNDPALASKMIIELSTVATNAGQAVQAMSMLKRMTPEGQLMALQKVADRINRERPNSNVKIPETIIDRVQRVNPRDTEAVDQIMHDGLVALAEQVPSTWLDKWNAWRYLAMLGNPRTHIRNIAGNAAFAPIVYTKDFLAGAIEGVVDAVSKATGGQGIARTKTALSALPFSKRSEYLDFVREDFQKMKDVINGGGGKNPADVVRDNQKVFTSKLMQPVEKAGKRSSKLLEAEDLAFKKIHYERALMQYLAANKIDLSTVTEETLNRGRNYAIREAQKATFADASAFASALNRLSRQHKAAQFLIEGNLPFKKTPVNTLKRGVEYSPAGILDTVTRKAYQLKSGKISAAEFIDSLSAGLTGTGVMALGMWLASAGLLSGGLGDDKDDQFSKLQGEQEYALKIGDTSYTIDWAAPAALPLFVGAEIVGLYRDSKTGEVPLSKLLESLTNLSEPMVNMSMLQGINDAIENVKFSDNPIVDFGMNAGVSYLSQGVPTLLGQIARTTDDTRRRNYVEQGSAFPTIQMALQRNKSKIPGALQTQQPYVDAWGREEPTGNIAERAFSNFLSPGYISEKQTSSMEKELERLYEETGDAGVLPSSAQKSVTNQGEKYVLAAEEYTEYQRTMGKTSYELLSKLTGSSEYKKLTDEQRTDAVSEVYSYAKDLAKEEMLKSRGVKYEPSSKRQSMDAAKKNGVPLSTYLLYSIQAKDLKSDKKSNGDTVSGSLKRKKEELLNNMGVTAQQKRVLLLLDGYGSKQQREQLLTGTVSSGSSYEETAIDRLLKGALS